MVDHCDFEEQVSVSTSEGRARPDMVVHLPDSLDIVIDAKTPLQGYLDALEADSDEKRESFGDAVVNTLATYFPNLKDLILHRQVLTPADVEEQIGISQGNIFHGELTLSQLFFLRPAAGYAKYRTPIKGYYQCGSGTHPGGGIMGAPGRLAALEVLKDI